MALNVNLLGHENMATKNAAGNNWVAEAYLKSFTGDKVSNFGGRRLLVKKVDGEVFQVDYVDVESKKGIECLVVRVSNLSTGIQCDDITTAFENLGSGQKTDMLFAQHSKHGVVTGAKNILQSIHDTGSDIFEKQILTSADRGKQM